MATGKKVSEQSKTISKNELDYIVLKLHTNRKVSIMEPENRRYSVVFGFWEEMKLIITMGNSRLAFPFVFFTDQLLIVTFSAS